MTSKFLSTQAVQLSDGSQDVFAASLGASDLNTSMIVKSNNKRRLVTVPSIAISEVTGLQAAIDGSGDTITPQLIQPSYTDTFVQVTNSAGSGPTHNAVIADDTAVFSCGNGGVFSGWEVDAAGAITYRGTFDTGNMNYNDLARYDANTVFVAWGNGLAAFTATFPISNSTPRETFAVSDGENHTAIVINDGSIIATMGNAGIIRYSYDPVTKLAIEVGPVDTPNTVWNDVVFGASNRYIAATNAGIVIGNATSLAAIGSAVPLDSNATCVTRDGAMVYAGTSNGTIAAIDYSDEAAPIGPVEVTLTGASAIISITRCTLIPGRTMITFVRGNGDFYVYEFVNNAWVLFLKYVPLPAEPVFNYTAAIQNGDYIIATYNDGIQTFTVSATITGATLPFPIQGDTIVNGDILADSVDTRVVGALDIGQINADQINIHKNTNISGTLTTATILNTSGLLAQFIDSGFIGPMIFGTNNATSVNIVPDLRANSLDARVAGPLAVGSTTATAIDLHKDTNVSGALVATGDLHCANVKAINDVNGNTSVGIAAGGNGTGARNTCIGYRCGDELALGFDNTAIGHNAFASSLPPGLGEAFGDKNTVIGSQAGPVMKGTGNSNFNTVIGFEAAKNMSFGDKNTLVGAECGGGLVGGGSGNNNVALGYQSNYSTATSNSITINAGTVPLEGKTDSLVIRPIAERTPVVTALTGLKVLVWNDITGEVAHVAMP